MTLRVTWRDNIFPSKSVSILEYGLAFSGENVENFGNFGSNFTATKLFTVAYKFSRKFCIEMARHLYPLYVLRVCMDRNFLEENRTGRQHPVSLKCLHLSRHPRRSSLSGLCQSGSFSFFWWIVDGRKKASSIWHKKKERRINRTSRVKLPHHVELCSIEEITR